MENVFSRKIRRKRIHERVRRKISGSSNSPRLCVFRSKKHIYAQLIDDSSGRTVLEASTLSKEFKDSSKRGGTKDGATEIGALIARKAKEKGIKKVVFDRGGYLYHGRIKALAESSRKEGLEF